MMGILPYIYFLLLSELLKPKGQPIKTSLQAWRYFNRDSQTAFWCILSDWARVQRSTVWQREKHEDDVKNPQ